MACIAAPKIPALSIPGLPLPPALVIGIPSIGIQLCCKFATPPITVAIPGIEALIAALGLTGVLPGVLATINTQIDEMNTLLDKLQFSCPLD